MREEEWWKLSGLDETKYAKFILTQLVALGKVDIRSGHGGFKPRAAYYPAGAGLWGSGSGGELLLPLLESVKDVIAGRAGVSDLQAHVESLEARKDLLKNCRNWRTLGAAAGEAGEALPGGAALQPLLASLEQQPAARMQLEELLGCFRALRVGPMLSPPEAAAEAAAVDILILVCSPAAHTLPEAPLEAHCVAACFERAGQRAIIQMGGDAQAGFPPPTPPQIYSLPPAIARRCCAR